MIWSAVFLLLLIVALVGLAVLASVFGGALGHALTAPMP